MQNIVNLDYDLARVDELPGEKSSTPAPRTRSMMKLLIGAAACVCVFVCVVTIVFLLATSSSSSAADDDVAPVPSVEPTIPITSAGPVSTIFAPADAPSPLVELTFLCNLRFANGTCRSYFTVENSGAAAITVTVGADNFVEPGPDARGQPTVFAPDIGRGAASFLWNCHRYEQARWTVRTNDVATVAVAPRQPILCPTILQLMGLG